MIDGVQTTEEWSFARLQSFLLFSKSESAARELPEKAGSDLFSLSLYALMHDTEPDDFQYLIAVLIEKHCHGDTQKIEEFYYLFKEIIEYARIMVVYCKNSRTVAWLRAQPFLDRWKDGDSYLPV